jgi:transcriptional regulator
MYIPPYYELKDPEIIREIIVRNGFGLLVTDRQATHLAFTVETDEQHRIELTGHMARNNPQALQLGTQALAVFQGPHGYISPKLYTRHNSVPTWNYVAVHCYGIAEVLPDHEHFSVVEELIQAHEPDFISRWQSLPDAYRDGLSKGIVAFRMKVEKIEAKLKLSQDRSKEERENIIRHLRASGHSSDHDLADWMERVL